MTSNTKEVVERLFGSMLEGDFETVLATLSDDILWRNPGAVPQAGLNSPILEGKQQWLEAFQKVGEFTGGSLRFEVQSIYTDDATAIVHSRNSATRSNGSSLDLEMIFLVKVKNQQVVEVTEFPHSAADWLAFWCNEET